MDSFKTIVKENMALLRSKLDQIPVLHEIEVKNKKCAFYIMLRSIHSFRLFLRILVSNAIDWLLPLYHRTK